MSSPSSPPSILDLPDRRAERSLARGVIALAVFVPWLFAAPLLLQGMGSIVLGCLTYAGVRRSGWVPGPHRIARIAWLTDARWELTTSSGERRYCELHPSTRVGSYAIWLRLRSAEPARRDHCFLLTRTDASADAVRRLSVRLRLEGAKNLAPAEPLSQAPALRSAVTR
jgi:hypothetical protein